MTLYYPLSVRCAVWWILSQQWSLLTAASPVRLRANAAFPDPNIDPFYQAPENLTDYRLGEVIRSRKADVDVSQIGASAFQIYYRTSDWKDADVGTVATVWKPAIPVSPPKVVHYAFAEDAINVACAPSWAFIKNGGSQAQPAEREILGPILIPWALANGYHVVLADAEGPDSTFLLGQNEGRASLDGLRAAMNFQRLPANRTDIAIIGYSGGAHTAVWTSELAAVYAPELVVKGAAFGGTPIDPRAVFLLADNTTYALVLLAALLGLSNGYSDLDAVVNASIKPYGRQLEADLREPFNCTQASGAPPLELESLFNSADLIDEPTVASILRNESLLMNVSSINIPAPTFPRLQYHGMADELAPYWAEAAYVEQQCAKGADIRFVSFPNATHETAAVDGLIGALKFVQQALSGTVPDSPVCGSALADMPLVESVEALAILGTVLADALLALVNNNIL